MANEEGELFMNTLDEINRELNYFDNLIASSNDGFSIFFLTTDDETLIRFYQYLKRKKKFIEYGKEENVSLDRVNYLIDSLEKCDTIKNHLEASKNIQIEETLRLLEEKKMKKMNPIKRLIYKAKKK